MLLFSLLLATLSHAASSHRVPAPNRLPASAPTATWDAAELSSTGGSLPNKVSLQLVMLKDSGWTVEQVKKDVKEAAPVFEQCKVQVSKAELWVVPAPGGVQDFVREKGGSSTAPNTLRGLAQNFVSLGRPIIFFVRDFYYPEDKPEGLSTPFSQANFEGDPPLPEELLNVVWMPVSANAPDYYETHCKSTQYSVLAHELAHVLTGEGQHNVDPEPNILTQCMLKTRNNRLTAKQCEEILASPLVSK